MGDPWDGPGQAIILPGHDFNADTGAVVAPTTDTSGGYQLDSIHSGVRVDYRLYVQFADTYTASFRVATAGGGASFILINDSTGAVLDTVVLPNTGGLRSWQTVTIPFTLKQGYMALRILGNSATVFDLNWIDIEMQAPPPVSQAYPLPGMVQAENYFGSLGVATQPTTDIGHGLNVGWIDLWDWMNYYIDVPGTGYYTLSFRVATPYDQASFLVSDLTTRQWLLTVGVPNTGGLQNWTTVSSYTYLTAGPHVLQIQSTWWSIWNFNWMYIGYGFPGGPSYEGKVQAVNWQYESGVQYQLTADSGGGYNVGWIDIYDWMQYHVYTPQGGRQTASFRIATPYDNASFQVLDNNANVLATVNVPNTGGFQNWQTVQTSLNLPQGVDTVWIMSTSWDIWNIHWMDFEPATDSSAIAAPVIAQVARPTDSVFAANTILWPNPTRDNFTIQMNDTLQGKMVVQVIDGEGASRLVTNSVKTPGVSSLTVPISELPSGVYFVRIIVDGEVLVRKVLKL
jgi:endoglucanase